MCLSTTQLLVLLVACPPGPDPLTNCSSSSSSFRAGRSIRSFLPAVQTSSSPDELGVSRGEPLGEPLHNSRLDTLYMQLLSGRRRDMSSNRRNTKRWQHYIKTDVTKQTHIKVLYRKYHTSSVLLRCLLHGHASFFCVFMFSPVFFYAFRQQPANHQPLCFFLRGQKNRRSSDLCRHLVSGRWLNLHQVGDCKQVFYNVINRLLKFEFLS